MAWKDAAARRAYDRQWSKTRKKSRYRLNRVWQDKRRAWFKEFKKTLKCERCPETHPATLQFHHKDPSTKSAEIGSMVQRWSVKRILEEVAKCEVLCANCHAKEHWTE